MRTHCSSRERGAHIAGHRSGHKVWACFFVSKNISNSIKNADPLSCPENGSLDRFPVQTPVFRSQNEVPDFGCFLVSHERETRLLDFIFLSFELDQNFAHNVGPDLGPECGLRCWPAMWAPRALDEQCVRIVSQGPRNLLILCYCVLGLLKRCSWGA